MELFLGLDVGGSTSRAALHDASGTRLGTGRAGGGNPVAHPVPVALSRIAAAARDALAGHPPGRVAGVVLGLAGRGALDDPPVAAAFSQMWRGLGLSCPVRVVADPLLAYVSGTSAPSGSVLLAGTGAVALRVRDLDVAAAGDGFGWLLGDEGSGFWIGRAAARATLRDLTRGSPGPLACLVTARVTGRPVPPLSAAVAEELIRRAQADPVGVLAPLAELAEQAAAAGDRAAAAIVDGAADRLVRTLATVREPGDTTPIVLAGGVLTAGAAVAARVRRLCGRRWDAPVLVMGDTAGAAAWLAALDRRGAGMTGPHARFVQTSVQ